MIPIDEQITKQRRHCNQFKDGYDILASLERLKRIDSVQVPDYPTVWAGGGAGPHVDKKDYDTLRDLLRRVTAERDACAQTNDDQAKRVFAAEAELAETKRLLVEAREEGRIAGMREDCVAVPVATLILMRQAITDDAPFSKRAIAAYEELKLREAITRAAEGKK
jgi:hypothetical protein